MIHYTKIACDRCGDMYDILNTVADELGDPFVCNRCLRALVQERLNEPDADAPSHFGGCEKSDPSEVELDSDLIADLKQQLDLATDSSDFWYEQSMAGWKSAARLNEDLRSKEADLENERRAGDAMQESLVNLRNEHAELQESYKRLYSRKEFLECRFMEFKRQSLMYYKKYVEELGGRIDANKKLKRLESRWGSRLRAWLRGVWRYNIYCETCVKGED